jgi:hypothetical protein
MIVGAMVCFKRRRFSTPVKTNVLAFTIEALVVAFPLP